MNNYRFKAYIDPKKRFFKLQERKWWGWKTIKEYSSFDEGMIEYNLKYKNK